MENGVANSLNVMMPCPLGTGVFKGTSGYGWDAGLHLTLTSEWVISIQCSVSVGELSAYQPDFYRLRLMLAMHGFSVFNWCVCKRIAVYYWGCFCLMKGSSYLIRIQRSIHGVPHPLRFRDKDGLTAHSFYRLRCLLFHFLN